MAWKGISFAVYEQCCTVRIFVINVMHNPVTLEQEFNTMQVVIQHNNTTKIQWLGLLLPGCHASRKDL